MLALRRCWMDAGLRTKMPDKKAGKLKKETTRTRRATTVTTNHG